MAKHTIVIMPGDGIGNQVLPEAIRVLEAVGFDAEYIHADIGWECWIKEGNALPERTIDLLRTHKVGLFGAITSKPKKEAEAELSPALKGKGYQYFSPIVSMRQKFNLDICLRPCLSFPRQSAEFYPQKAEWRLRGAESRRRGLPSEHRRTLRRRRVEQSPATCARRIALSLQVQTFRERFWRGPCGFSADHHPSGGATHLRSGFPARAAVRL